MCKVAGASGRKRPRSSFICRNPLYQIPIMRSMPYLPRRGRRMKPLLELVARAELDHPRVGQRAGVLAEIGRIAETEIDGVGVKANGVRDVERLGTDLQRVRVIFQTEQREPLSEADVDGKEAIAADAVALSAAAGEGQA